MLLLDDNIRGSLSKNYRTNILLSAYEKSHVFVEVDCIPNNHSNMENLMTASKFVKFFGEVSFGKSHNVEKATTNVADT